MRVIEVNDFESVENEWNALLSKSPDNNIFLTWEWLSTWWRHFREGRKLLILLVKKRNATVAAAPLMLSEYRLPSFGSIRKIEFIGTPHSDYHCLLQREQDVESVRGILGFLESTCGDWDWVELKDVPETALCASYLPELKDLSSELELKKRVSEVCPYVSLPSSIHALMKGLPRMRRNMDYYQRKIKRDYSLELRRHSETGSTLRESMKTFFDLHQRRWQSEGKPGAFGEGGEKLCDFHLDVAEQFAKKGWLGLYFLTADEEPVAAQYAFEYEKKMYNYLNGSDPEYSAYSVGNLLIRFLLEECIKRGFAEYDFMRGDEPYKTMWTHNFRRNLEMRFVHKALLTQLYNWVTWSDSVSKVARRFHLSLTQAPMR